MDNPVVSGPVHGFYIHWYKQLGSTNDQALHLINTQTEPVELVICTDHQTQGRGQGTNSWLSLPGQNLLFSLIYYPSQLSAQDTFILNQLVATASHKTLAKYLPEHDLLLKWPNDLWVGQQKLGGVLIQTGISGQFVKWAVIGIGINVNSVDFPSALTGATSLKILTHKTFDLSELLNGFLAEFSVLRRAEYPELKQYYRLHLLGWQQNNIYQTPDGQIFTGRFADLDDQGQMMIKMGSELRTFQQQQIKYLRPAV